MNPIDNGITARDVVLRLGAAMLIGAIIGINRDLHEKPAGLRTLGLVSTGAALLTLVSLAFAAMQRAADPSALSRVAQGIITGIGFLGAGVILRGEREQSIQGLTTAASIWFAACLGIVCGAGQWTIALAGIIVAMLLLVIGGPIEQAIHRRWKRGVRSEARSR